MCTPISRNMTIASIPTTTTTILLITVIGSNKYSDNKKGKKNITSNTDGTNCSKNKIKMTLTATVTILRKQIIRTK